MSDKLNVAFLWHMHQPFYREPASGKYLLPWVRLHGTKGYTDMLAAVRRFGDVRVTFNFSPCLLQQISDLSQAEAKAPLNSQTDLYYDLTLKSPADLEVVEKKIILRHFFAANWETMVLPYPRYRDLLFRRGRQVSENSLDEAIARFSAADFMDLQVWFNLAWFGWAAQEKYPLISQLKRRGRDFSGDDKTQVLHLQQEVLSRLIPDYRSAWEEGLIEIAISPFYHPILPLLVDNYSARLSQPQDPMPQGRFRRPGDALEQLQRGLDYAQEKFGRKPVGLWPSEGSVSPAVCELAHQVGFQWLATDEAVLSATLGETPDRSLAPCGRSREDLIYQTYRTSTDGPAIIFRDRFLSDAIGFRYARNTPQASVDDLLGHLENIAQNRKSSADSTGVPACGPENSLVSIILDGENAWEYFNDGGQGFFQELYGRLSRHPALTTTRINDFIGPRQAGMPVLPPIFPASWINGSFRIWIGDPVKNLAWDRLKATADLVDEFGSGSVGAPASSGVPTGKKDAVKRAQECLLVAEGSDWFWWYGEPNSSDFDLEFDQLFRLNQIQVYKDLSLPIPEDLTRPIEDARKGLSIDEQVLFPMQPVIDGRETTYYEWIGARVIRSSDYSGSMYMTTALLKRLFYGLSPTHLFLRLDPSDQFRALKEVKVVVRFVGKGQSFVELTGWKYGSRRDAKNTKKLAKTEKGNVVATWCCDTQAGASRPLKDAAYENILEVAIPFEILPRVENEVRFAVMVMGAHKGLDYEMERWPRMGSFSCPWPTEDYLTGNWVV